MKRFLLLTLIFILGCEYGKTMQVPYETGEPLQIFFCPREDCTGELVRFLNQSSESIYCAIYEVNIKDVISILQEKERTIHVDVIVDESNYKGLEKYSFITPVKRKGIMHHKFCIVDYEWVFTGSFNPTEGGLKNNNNALFINSRILARNYFNEYERIKSNNNGKTTNEFIYNNRIIKNYFCATDDCSERIKRMIGNAKKSVYFMVFAFTDTGIANELILAKQRGIAVEGVIEKRNAHNASVYPFLAYQKIDVSLDKNKYNLHHKVFIIDNLTVITGSFNPSNNANFRNDENIIVLNSPDIAQEFLEEYELMR